MSIPIVTRTTAEWSAKRKALEEQWKALEKKAKMDLDEAIALHEDATAADKREINEKAKAMALLRGILVGARETKERPTKSDFHSACDEYYEAVCSARDTESGLQAALTKARDEYLSLTQNRCRETEAFDREERAALDAARAEEDRIQLKKFAKAHASKFLSGRDCDRIIDDMAWKLIHVDDGDHLVQHIAECAVSGTAKKLSGMTQGDLKKIKEAAVKELVYRNATKLAVEVSTTIVESLYHKIVSNIQSHIVFGVANKYEIRRLAAASRAMAAGEDNVLPIQPPTEKEAWKPRPSCDIDDDIHGVMVECSKLPQEVGVNENA